MRRHEAARQRMKHIAAIILAAGSSRRMGANKLLLSADGQPMVRRAALLCQAAGLSPIIAVLGHAAAQVEQALAGLQVEYVLNENHATGMASSLTTGLAALPAQTQAALICLPDMPRVTPGDIANLCAAFAPGQGRAICIPTHAGRRGNPVLLGAQIFPALAGLSGDQGAKPIIQQHAHLVAEIPCGPGVLQDIDTPEAYAAYLRIS
jgi:molybdenum cofactor cytidylyltransferase